MPIVHIPPQLRSLTGGERTLDVAGRTLGNVIDAVDARFPGFRDRVVDDGKLRAGLAAAIGSAIASRSLAQEVPEGGEIHFIPAVSGGDA